MIRLLFVDHTPFAGGAQLVLAEHIAQLDKSVFEVHIACTDTVPQLIERYSQAGAQVHVIDLSQLKRGSLRSLLRLGQSVSQVRRLIQQHDIKIVVTNTTRSCYVASLEIIGLDVSLFWWIRDFLYPLALFRLLKPLPKRIICVSQAIKTHYMPQDDPKGVVIYVASNIYKKIEQIRPDMIVSEREKWGIAPTDMLIGYMGRLVAEKGPEDLFLAFERLLKTYPFLKLIYVGTGKDQAHTVEEQLQRNVRHAGLTSRIIFAGYQDNEALYYSIFDLFVLTTRDYEAFATTIVQALMATKPVIATSVGGTPELIADHETGLLVPPQDPVALAQAIESLIHNPDLAKSLAVAGHTRVMERHREEVATAQLAEMYRKCVKDVR